MLPTRIFFEVHYSRRLLITYSFNDFLIGYLASFRIVSLVYVQTCVFIQNYVHVDFGPLFLGIIIGFVQVWSAVL